MDNHYLNECWSLYFHDPSDENWDRTSFQRVVDLTTIEDFWGTNMMLVPRLHLGMFFVMRESVFPLWEEKENRDGGYLSLKILKAHVPDTWEDLCAKMLSETILKPEHQHLWNHVNGISISPKKTFCIIKIWLKSQEVNNPAMFNIRGPDFTEILYSSHAALGEAAAQKAAAPPAPGQTHVPPFYRHGQHQHQQRA